MADESCTFKQAHLTGPEDDRVFQVHFSCGRVIANPVFVSPLTKQPLRVHLLGGAYSTEPHESRAWALEKLVTEYDEEALQGHLDRLAADVPEEWSVAYLDNSGTDLD